MKGSTKWSFLSFAVNQSPSSILRKKESTWKFVAKKLYEKRKRKEISVGEIFGENEELFAPLLVRCPRFAVILNFILENKVGFRVKDVDWTSKMTEWGEEECKIVGRSLATLIRKRKTGQTAVDAWRLHYMQLKVLFEEVEGFEHFMLVIANNLLRDSIYGMVLRVSVGAVLSITDAVSDIYVISREYGVGSRE